MSRNSTDPKKEKFQQDVKLDIEAFFAAGGKTQELDHGESGDGKRSFTISPARKDLPVKP